MNKSGIVAGVCLSERRTDPKKNVGKGIVRKGVGLVGDSHAGTEKEVSLLAMESIHRLCQETGIFAEPGSFAENITTEGSQYSVHPYWVNITNWRGKTHGDPDWQRSISSSYLQLSGIFYFTKGRRVL